MLHKKQCRVLAMNILDNLCSVEYEVVKPGSMVTKLSSTWFVTHSWKTSNQKVISNKYAHSDRTVMEYEYETLNSKVLWSWGLFLILLCLVFKHLAISIGWERPSLVILVSFFHHISKNRNNYTPAPPKRGYTVLPLSVLPSVQDIFRRIILWQKSDIWSQASFRYAILWEAFYDPLDSYFLFSDLVGFYTHWTYMRGHHKWALAHSSSCYFSFPENHHWPFYYFMGI